MAINASTLEERRASLALIVMAIMASDAKAAATESKAEANSKAAQPTLTLEEVRSGLESADYLPDEGLVAAVYLAMTLRRPLLLEGEAGVGKTEVAKALSAWTGGALIRLQCYEGISISQAVYEWDYARQILSLRVAEAGGNRAAATSDAASAETGDETNSSSYSRMANTASGIRDAKPGDKMNSTASSPTLQTSDLYSEQFLVRRPLLQAVADESPVAPVLLIDEIDRADDEFEAFLLEVLSDWTITVPEIGAFTASQPPLTIITSNRTRDIHDALRRRCLYHWVEHPDLARETAIVSLRSSASSETLARQVAAASGRLRNGNFYKPPSVAESIAWADALSALGVEDLDEASAGQTLGAVLKYREDQERARANGLGELVAEAVAGASAESDRRV